MDIGTLPWSISDVEVLVAVLNRSIGVWSDAVPLSDKAEPCPDMEGTSDIK